MSDSFNKNRIIKNTTFLYLRMFFTMWFNLWATRLVLTNLGIEDMGVYGVVGSLVGLFSVFTVGITSAVQRFITFELGSKEGNINRVFCTSINVILILSILIILVLETFGLIFLNTSIKIPPQSQEAAFWTFQLSVLTCIIEMISIPYNAMIIANEKMEAFASISILQVLLSWGTAFSLSYFAKDERLIIYALSLTLVAFLTRAIYQIYCTIKFPESKFHFLLDKGLIKQIGLFTGISTTSNILETIASQGIVLIINWTLGVGFNAVYQIALQLKNAILSFALNISRAISPQITKTYADGEMELHQKLVYSGSKIEIYMILFIMIPFIFRADYILGLWLGHVPPYTKEFCICQTFISLTYAGFEPLRSAVLATNKIKNFMIYPTLFYLITILPIAYFIGNMTGNPIFLMLTIVGLDIGRCIVQVFYAQKVTFIRFQYTFKAIIMPCLLIMTLSSVICYILAILTNEDLLGFFILLVLNSLALLVTIYFLGINQKERQTVNNLIVKAYHIIK